MDGGSPIALVCTEMLTINIHELDTPYIVPQCTKQNCTYNQLHGVRRTRPLLFFLYMPKIEYLV